MHPLAGLQEFVDIHSNYQREGAQCILGVEEKFRSNPVLAEDRHTLNW